MKDRYEYIPQELKMNGLFCYWKLKEGQGKVPFNPIDGTYAKSNDPRTFSSYAMFCKYTEKFMFDNKTSGVGLGIFNGYSAIDIDHCVDSDGTLSLMAQDIIRYCNSYTEYSPSGTGIRIIFKTNNLIQKDHYYIQNHNIGLEIYISNNTNKFVTLTGKKYKDKEDINTVDLSYILNKYMLKEKALPAGPEFRTCDLINNYNLDEVLTHDRKLYELWNSIPSGSGGNESETDLALCAKLAYYCGGDREKVERLFVSSPYYQAKDSAHKAKWEIRDTYRNMTINKAVQGLIVKPGSGEVVQTLAESIKYHDLSQGTDNGNAHVFVELFGKDYRYNVDNKKWMFWNGSYWEVDSKNQIYGCFEELAEYLKKNINLIDDSTEAGQREKQEFIKNIKKLYNKATEDNVLELAATIKPMPVTNAQFDTESKLLNTGSGLINLINKQEVENGREHYISMSTHCKVSYEEPVKFINFLRELTCGDIDLQNYLHKILGYSLLGEIREPYIYLLYGNGRNGKSLLLSVIRQVLGDYSQTLESGALVENKYQSVDRGQIALLVHKRFIVSEETKETDHLNEKLIKNITSAGEMEGKVLYGNPFKFRIEGKVFSSTNHLPKITGADEGIWRRIITIPCDYKVNDKTDNLDLEKELLLEKEKILGWLINGCVLYLQEGLYKVPARIKATLNEYKKEMDVITNWISERCECNDKYSERAAVLFKNFDDWRCSTRENAMTQTAFGLRMKKLFKKTQTSSGYYYIGIRLKPVHSVERELNYAKIEIDSENI